MTYLTQFGGDKLTTMLPSFYYNLQTIPANFILFANNQPTPSYHIIVYHSIIFFYHSSNSYFARELFALYSL